MKGGAIFNPAMQERRIRTLASMGAAGQSPDVTSDVYRSPRRLFLAQEITQYNYQDPDSPRIPSWKNPSPQVGNIHGVLITLPETEGSATYDFYPSRNNYFQVQMPQIFRAIANALHHGQPDYSGFGILVLKDEVSPKVRRRQLESVKAVGTKGKLPEVVEQKVAAMAGLTPGATERVPISDVQSNLLASATEEARADAIIDAAVAWVKAWNVEHFAQKGKKKQATQARKQAEAALDDVKAGRAPRSASSSSAAPQGSSSSSSSSSAAPPPPPPPPGPTAEELEERATQETLAAMRGGRRKTKRFSKTRRTTRRR